MCRGITDLRIFNVLKNKLKKRCLKCNTVFFQPGLMILLKKKFFVLYGQHNMGWQNFYDFKNKLLSPNHGNLFNDLKRI